MFKIITTIALTAVFVSFYAERVPSHAAAQSSQKQSSIGAGQSKDEEEATVVDPERISESSRIRGRLFSLGDKNDDLVANKAWGEKEPLMTILARPWMSFEWEENLDDLNQYINKTACRAEAIVVGGVVSKTSQLTEYRDYVFTDYEVKVEEVLKNTAAAKLEINSPIVVSSGGGSVKVGDKVIRFADESWARYKKGGRYLFFLKYAPPASVYQGIIGDIAFGLDEGHVTISNPSRYSELNHQLDNMGESSLIEQARQAVSNCR